MLNILFRDGKSQRIRSVQHLNLQQGFNECCGQVGVVNVLDHFCDVHTMSERARRLNFCLLQCGKCFFVAKTFLELRYHKFRVHRGIDCKMCALCRRVYEHDFCFNEHLCCVNGFLNFDSRVVYMYGDGSIF